MLSNVKLAAKLIIAFVALTVISLGIGAAGYYGLHNLQTGLQEVADVRLPGVQALLVISEAQTAVDSAENALLAKNLDEKGRKEAYDRFDAAKKRADDAWKIYEPLPQSKEEAEVWKEFVPAWEKWWSDHEEYVKVAKEYEQNPSEELYNKMSSQALVANGISFSASENLLNRLIEINDSLAKEETKKANSTASTCVVILIGAIGLGCFLSFVLGSFFVKNINTILNGLMNETKHLIEAATGGKLDVRGDPAKINFEFRPVVEGINQTLDAVIGPLNVAAEYIERIGKGDIPPKITDNYNGDFNEIKNNLNLCIDSINALTSDTDILINAAVEGKLDTRADASKHHGDYRKIVEGVNKTLDAVIGPLNVAAEYVDRISKGDIPPKITDKYNGDFNEIKNNLNLCIDSINALTADTNILINAAVEGKLDTRADRSEERRVGKECRSRWSPYH